MGWITTNPLEKCFGKLTQGCGGAYFISAKSVLEKLNIQRASIALKLQLTCINHEGDGHFCISCLQPKVLDNLNALKESVNIGTANAVDYIAGYVQAKARSVCANDTYFYSKRYGLYLNNLNRGGLAIPGDSIVQWIIYCYIFFVSIRGNSCRNFLISCFFRISNKFILDASTLHAHILANIFLKNVSIFSTPQSSKKASLKILKLKS